MLVVVFNRDYVDLDIPSLQVIHDVFQLADGFCSVTDQYDSPQMLLRQHRRTQSKRLLQIGCVLTDLRIDVFFKRKSFAGWIFDRRRSAKHDHASLIGHRLLSSRACDQIKRLVASFVNGIRHVDIIDHGDNIAAPDSSRFRQYDNQQSANHQPDERCPCTAFFRQSRMTGRLHPPQPWSKDQQRERPWLQEFQFAHKLKLRLGNPEQSQIPCAS